MHGVQLVVYYIIMVLTQEVIQRGIRDCKAVSCSDLHEGSCNLKFL